MLTVKQKESVSSDNRWYSWNCFIPIEPFFVEIPESSQLMLVQLLLKSILTSMKNFTSILQNPLVLVHTSGGGVGTVVTFRNPGVGATSVFIPTQAIYYKNHGLKLNERVDYFANGGTSLQVWSGFTTDGYVNLTDYDTLYATPITEDLIGISSSKVGLSTVTGKYVGTGVTNGLIFFNGIGSGDYHSLKTSRNNVLRGSANTSVVTVSVAFNTWYVG